MLILGLGSLAACGTPPRPGDTSPVAAECTRRAIVTVRQTSGIHNDAGFNDLTSSLGIEVEVLYNMSRNSRMVRVRAAGPDIACREIMDELRRDPRIESVNEA